MKILKGLLITTYTLVLLFTCVSTYCKYIEIENTNTKLEAFYDRVYVYMKRFDIELVYDTDSTIEKGRRTNNIGVRLYKKYYELFENNDLYCEFLRKE